MGEPNGKYSVRGVCVCGRGRNPVVDVVSGAASDFFFFFPRNPPDVDGDPVEVSAASLRLKLRPKLRPKNFSSRASFDLLMTFWKPPCSMSSACVCQRITSRAVLVCSSYS